MLHLIISCTNQKLHNDEEKNCKLLWSISSTSQNEWVDTGTLAYRVIGHCENKHEIIKFNTSCNWPCVILDKNVHNDEDKKTFMLRCGISQQKKRSRYWYTSL